MFRKEFLLIPYVFTLLKRPTIALLEERDIEVPRTVQPIILLVEVPYSASKNNHH